ncbi:hypothetical protein MMC30_009132 [Trapelia coarctata]|nr:hypothetical protein [Trapelia coarctata]
MNEASFLEDLNPAQKSAVESPAAVLQILAPPGSGKTKTLTARVAYLLSHHKYKPWNTLCLTFTIKSAKEMKERISKLVGPALGSKIVLGTFHSVCRRYLVTYGYLIGIRKGFGIADSSDTLAIITRIVKRLNLNIDPKAAKARISSSKARSISYAELLAEASKKKNVEQQGFITVFEAYEAHLATSNLLDYDDLLLRCVDLLRENPTCVSNIEAVLIDEFQDTNIVQFDLMRLFAAKCNRITTVGDPDQSIYGWRSAEIKNLRKMQKQYPDTLVIHLEDNYRSSGSILLAALEVIQQDESRPAKPLLPTHCPGPTPVLRRLPSAAIEASWIVTEIQRCIGLTGSLLNFADFSILLRSASLSRQIETAMGKAGIPYRMVGGQRFYDRVEVKILLDYLRVISQPDNSDALARIINVPSRKIGDITSRGLLEEAAARGSTLWRLVQDVVRGQMTIKTKISKVAAQGLASVMNIVLKARKKMLDPSNLCLPHQLLDQVIQGIEFKDFLEKTKPEDHESRWANVEELMAQASDCSLAALNPSFSPDDDGDEALPLIEGVEQESAGQAEDALAKFLAIVALSTQVEREEDAEAESGPQQRVAISTIHAAKGLEWPVVFIPSAYDGSIPHSRAEDTNEERRLLYVAMTRAQALLYISCPTRNSMREETTLSQFLSAKKVVPYLTDHGPSLRFSTTYDISGILRRDCPSEEILRQGLGNVENLEDNLWPLTGEEDPEVVAERWAGGDSRRSVAASETMAKRRKIGGNDLVVQTEKVSPTSSNSSATLPLFKTIIGRGSAYPATAQRIGFVSATTQLQHMQEALSEERKPKQSATKTNAAAKAGALGKASCNTDSQSLMKYFTSSKLEQQSSILPLQHVASIVKSVKGEDRGTGRRPDSDENPEHPTAVLSKLPQASRYIEGFRPRKPMAAIPPSLANHSFGACGTTTRPKIDLLDKNHTAKAYVFLSSSPPRANDASEEPTMKATSMSYGTEKACIVEPRSEDSAPLGHSRPPLTCHVTSEAMLKARNQGPRKTLGVRRSMAGWSARGSHSFDKPRSLH